MFGFKLKRSAPPSKCDRHARLGVESLEDRTVPAIIFTDTYDFGGVATVTVTVDDEAPGYAGKYLWNYHVTNDGFGIPGEGIGEFNVQVGDPDNTSDLGSTTDWPLVGVQSASVDWLAGEEGTTLEIGQSADFWFTTAPTAVILAPGYIADRGFSGGGPGGDVAAPAPALIVTTNIDEEINNGLTSLREAIAVVNSPQNLAGIWRVAFKDPTLTGATITLDPTKGQLTLKKPIFIDGKDQEITIQRDPSTATKHRIFEVQGTTAKLKGLTLRNGKIDGPGGAVLSSGDLTVENCTFEQNEATGSTGGAVAALSKTFTSINSYFTSNTAMLGGGILIGERVTTSITGGSITNNVALSVAATSNGKGGGIYIYGSATTTPTSVTLSGVQVSANSAYNAGGGIYVNPDGTGATFLMLTGGTTIECNSVTQTGGKGGGVYFGRGALFLYGVTIDENVATTGANLYMVSTGTILDEAGDNTWDGEYGPA